MSQEMYRRERRGRGDKRLERNSQCEILGALSNDSVHEICAERPDIHCVSAISALSAVNKCGLEQHFFE
jgi:hypothetical protein